MKYWNFVLFLLLITIKKIFSKTWHIFLIVILILQQHLLPSILKLEFQKSPRTECTIFTLQFIFRILVFWTTTGDQWCFWDRFIVFKCKDLVTKNVNLEKRLRGESHIVFRTQCVIMTFVGGGLSLITFWNSEKLSNLKVHLL